MVIQALKKVRGGFRINGSTNLTDIPFFRELSERPVVSKQKFMYDLKQFSIVLNPAEVTALFRAAGASMHDKAIPTPKLLHAILHPNLRGVEKQPPNAAFNNTLLNPPAWQVSPGIVKQFRGGTKKAWGTHPAIPRGTSSSPAARALQAPQPFPPAERASFASPAPSSRMSITSSVAEELGLQSVDGRPTPELEQPVNPFSEEASVVTAPSLRRGGSRAGSDANHSRGSLRSAHSRDIQKPPSYRSYEEMPAPASPSSPLAGIGTAEMSGFLEPRRPQSAASPSSPRRRARGPIHLMDKPDYRTTYQIEFGQQRGRAHRVAWGRVPNGEGQSGLLRVPTPHSSVGGH